MVYITQVDKQIGKTHSLISCGVSEKRGELRQNHVVEIGGKERYPGNSQEWVRFMGIAIQDGYLYWYCWVMMNPVVVSPLGLLKNNEANKAGMKRLEQIFPYIRVVTILQL